MSEYLALSYFFTISGGVMFFTNLLFNVTERVFGYNPFSNPLLSAVYWSRVISFFLALGYFFNQADKYGFWQTFKDYSSIIGAVCIAFYLYVNSKEVFFRKNV